MIYLDLTFGLTLLMALGMVSGIIERRWDWHSRLGVLLQGGLFGGACVLGMLRPLNLGPGLIYDGQSIMVSLCALFFGPWAAAAAGAIAVAWRIWPGDAGMVTGSLVVLSSAGIGLLAHFRLKPQAKPPSLKSLYLFGLAVQLAELALMSALTAGAGLAAVMRIALPATLLFPLATVLAGKILSDQLKAAQAGEVLRDSEAFPTMLLDAIPIPVFYKHRDGRYLGFNKAFEAFFGATSAQMIGKTVFDIHPPELAEIYHAKDTELFEGGGAQQYESRIKNARGEMREVALSQAVYTDRQGAVSGLIGTILDITEHKRIEEGLRRERALLRCLIDSANDLIFFKDQDGFYKGCNKASEAFMGIPESGQIGKTDFDFFDRQTAEEIRKYDRQVLEGGKPLRTEQWATRSDGGKVLLDILKAPYYGPAGEVLGLVGIGRDITERKLAEVAWQRSNEMLRAIIEAAPTAIIGLDLEGNVHSVWNPAAEKMLGWSAREVMGRPLPTVPMESQAEFKSFRDQIRRGLTLDGMEVRRQRRDGTPIDCSIYASPLHDAKGRITGNIAVLVDITERKRAEEDRLAHLRFFESMDQVNRAIQGARGLDSMMSDVLDAVLAIFDCDRAWLVYPCDPEATSWSVSMERTRPEFPSTLASGLAVPMDPDAVWVFQTVRSSDGPVNFGPGSEHPLPAEVAERFNVQSQIALAIYPKLGQPWMFGLHQCSHDRVWTAEEKRILQEIGRRLSDSLTSLLTYRDLRKSEEFLDSIVENIPNMIFVKDVQTLRFVRFNRAGEQLLGISREELLGKDVYDLFQKKEADFFTAMDHQVLSTKGLADIPEETIRTRSQDERILHTKMIPILDESGEPKYLLGISEDVTERKKLEGQLRQAQKIEAVGQLAGGVAHDFNNMLGVIIGYTELALSQLNPDHPLISSLKEIRKAADRSAGLTRQLLAFARKQTAAPKVLDLNATVEGMLKMLQRLIGEDIDLAWLPGTGVWPVKVDPSQIDQILANLCVNARDAIAGVGKLTIETQSAALNEAYCAEHPGIIPGEYVLLAVSDDGCGMDRETLGKIFEPFFTTKAMGKGTGLGLATIYGIVKQNNGFINVYSEPDHGTTFKIYLPRHAPATGQMPQKSATVPAIGGHETTLVVEDESAILNIAKLMLEKLGYRVLTAATPGEAIRAATEHAGKIDLLIADVVMPEMNVRDLAKSLTSLHPGLRCLYMSGYTDNVIARHGVLDDGVNFLQKPFSMETLAAKVRAALDSK